MAISVIATGTGDAPTFGEPATNSIRESCPTITDVIVVKGPPLPPSLATRAAQLSLSGLERLQEAFFEAGERLERREELYVNTLSGLEHELAAFIASARRRRLRGWVLMTLLPLALLAIAGVWRLFWG